MPRYQLPIPTGFPTGLTGTIGYTVLSPTGDLLIARTTTGVVEQNGIYFASVNISEAQLPAVVRWDLGTGNITDTAYGTLEKDAPIVIANDWIKLTDVDNTIDATKDAVKIDAKANSYALIQRDLYEFDKLEAIIVPHTDSGETWAPGISVKFNSLAIKIAVTNNNRINCIVNGDRKPFTVVYSNSDGIRCRLIRIKNDIVAQYYSENQWVSMNSIPINNPQEKRNPEIIISVGKSGPIGEPASYQEQGSMGSCSIVGISFDDMSIPQYI